MTFVGMRSKIEVDVTIADLVADEMAHREQLPPDYANGVERYFAAAQAALLRAAVVALRSIMRLAMMMI